MKLLLSHEKKNYLKNVAVNESCVERRLLELLEQIAKKLFRP